MHSHKMVKILIFKNSERSAHSQHTINGYLQAIEHLLEMQKQSDIQPSEKKEKSKSKELPKKQSIVQNKKLMENLFQRKIDAKLQYFRLDKNRKYLKNRVKQIRIQRTGSLSTSTMISENMFCFLFFACFSIFFIVFSVFMQVIINKE